MKRLLSLTICAIVWVGLTGGASGYCWAQTSGNIGFAQQTGSGAKGRAQQNVRARQALTPQELPPTDTSMFVDATVLMNVKADAYVAVFGIAQEGASVEECNVKMNATLKTFTDALKALNVNESDIYVDFVAQPKIYGYQISGDIARERIAGFELKKNVSIRYTDRDLIDRLVGAAASAQIYDLVKVDYVVQDVGAVHT